MSKPNDSRPALGNILLAGGLIILLAVAGYFGWTQLRAASLRAQLEQPAPAAVTVIPGPTLAPTEPPKLTATPAPFPTQAPEPAAPSAGPAASPTPIPTATEPAATPTPAAPTPTPPPPPAEPVRLVMAEPPINIDTKVVPMGWDVVQTADGPRSEWVIPKNEAGHHMDSVLLGEPGNLVISGHNNIYGKVFQAISFAWDDDRRVKVDSYTDRSDVLNGRQIQLFDAAGNVYTYVVTEFYRLKDTGVPLEQRIANARFMGPTVDTRLTVITCWPPTNNTHRLIVIATPVQ